MTSPQFRTPCALAPLVALGIGLLSLADVQAAKGWTPQEVETILEQSYRQLLLRPNETSLTQTPGPNQKRDTVQSGDAAQLSAGEKSAKQSVEVIALSPEYNAKWLTPHMETAQAGSAPGVPPVAVPEKGIDNLYCALLGRRVDSSSLASPRKYLVSSGFERVIRDLIDGKEYRDRFGDTNVPHLSREKQAVAGCPQGTL